MMQQDVYLFSGSVLDNIAYGRPSASREEIIEAADGSEGTEGDADASEGLAIGRGWFQAPEVDGCVVIRYERDIASEADAVRPGNVIKVQILSTTGVDLDGRFTGLVKGYPAKSDLQFIS